MATVPTPRSWSNGTPVGDDDLDEEIKGPLDFLLEPPMVHAYRSTSFTATNGTNLVVGLLAEAWDRPDPNHSTIASESRITVGTPGYWNVVAAAQFATSSAGERYLQVRQNAVGSYTGGTQLGADWRKPVAAGNTICRVVLEAVPLSVGDYIEAFVYQDSGADLTVFAGQWQTFISARWVGGL